MVNDPKTVEHMRENKIKKQSKGAGEEEEKTEEHDEQVK